MKKFAEKKIVYTFVMVAMGIMFAQAFEESLLLSVLVGYVVGDVMAYLVP